MDEHWLHLERKTLENQIQKMQREYIFPLLICLIVILAREKNRVLSPGKQMDEMQMN
jgi:hypothetical protein